MTMVNDQDTPECGDNVFLPGGIYRCALNEGHEGPCSAKVSDAGKDQAGVRRSVLKRLFSKKKPKVLNA
jgi:hypothetical protein